jgi:hypothetical protein
VLWDRKNWALVNGVAESADTFDILIIIKVITQVTTRLLQNTRKTSRETHLFGEEAGYKMPFLALPGFLSSVPHPLLDMRLKALHILIDRLCCD